MKKIIKLFLGFMICLYGSVNSHAESPLTGSDIQHFMKAMIPLETLGKKHNFDNNDDETALKDFDLTTFSPMTSSLKMVKEHAAYNEFETVVLKAGFSSVDQWANVGDRIMRAYMTHKVLTEMTPERKQEMQNSIAQIEKNQYLSQEMKTNILSNINKSLALEENMSDDTKADLENLKPHIPKLERLFEEEE